MQTPEPFLGVDFWYLQADIHIDATYKNRQHNYNYQTELREIFNKKDTPKIFVKTDLLPQYIDVLSNLNSKFILITASNDDHCVPYINYPCENELYREKVDKFIEKEELLVWYCKNPCICHDKLIGYPLGPKWQWKTTRFFGEDKSNHLRIYNELCKSPREKMINKDLKKNLLYFNFSQTTNRALYNPHKNIRHKVKSIIGKSFPWIESVDFETYMSVLETYKFSISPPGRGIDTHRAWESLMMGTIPIMMTTPLDHLFKNLPVIIIKDEIEWNNITPSLLDDKYNEILSKNETYNFDILYTHYWKKLLNSRENAQK